MSAKDMRKLMENVDMGMSAPEAPEAPVAPEMGGGNVNDTSEYVGDEMANGTAELDILDALQEEFKRIAAEYLQADGPLDEAGLSEVREKMGKFMTSILDLLHDGWMDNMMDGGDSEDESFPSENPFTSDDSDDSEKEDDDDDSDDSEKEEKDSDSDDDDDDDKEEKDSDSDDDDDDDKEEKSNNPFKYG